MTDTIYPIKLYLKHRPTLVLLVLSGALNLATWLALVLQLQPQDDPIFLHYTILFGVDFLGPWSHAFVVPAFGLAILTVNGLLGWLIFHKEKFGALLLNSVSMLCQIFLLVGAQLLVFLNG